jgi:hypothetical protein
VDRSTIGRAQSDLSPEAVPGSNSGDHAPKSDLDTPRGLSANPQARGLAICQDRLPSVVEPSLDVLSQSGC